MPAAADFETLARASDVGGSIYDPERHELIEHSAALRSFIARARVQGFRFADDVFLYRHRWRGEIFVIALWVQRPGDRPGVFTDLFQLEGHPDHEDCKGFPTADEIYERLRPGHEVVAEARRRMLDGKTEADARKQAEDDFREEYAKMLQKKLGNHDITPRLIRSGIIPIAGTGDPSERKE